MSMTLLSSLASAGSGLKALIILFLMGPVIDAFGPHVVIQWCLIGSALCDVALAMAPNSVAYSAAFLSNFVFNSFAEQPAFIVLFATYFDEHLGIACTFIASAYSLAGLVLPLVFGPLLAAFGWRLLWLVLAASCALVVPVICWLLHPGPISLKGPALRHRSLRATGRGIIMMARMRTLASNRASSAKDETEEEEGLSEGSFTGGRLSGTLARRASLAGDAFSLLHSLGRSGRLLPNLETEADPHAVAGIGEAEVEAHAEQTMARSITGSGGKPGMLATRTDGATTAGAAASCRTSLHEPPLPEPRPPPPPPSSSMTFSEALGSTKFWALATASFSFFIYGGQLNLHLPSILAADAGKSAVEAASIYSVYNGCAIAGKVLIGPVMHMCTCM